MQGDRYVEIIRPLLSEKRFLHSLNVAKSAAALADRYGANREKAYTAGILHDIMKDTDGRKQLQIIENSGIIFGSIDRAEPKLGHAKAGAAYVRDRLGEDDEIVQAIACHTTARGGMTRLDKVLFLADFISEDRDYDGVEEMRAATARSMEEGLDVALSFSIIDLVERRKAVHPDTLNAYNELILQQRAAERAY